MGIPNGDSFAGGQRYDDQTSKLLISDVCEKRYARDMLLMKNKIAGTSHQIYLQGIDLEKFEALGLKPNGKESASSLQMRYLAQMYQKDPSVQTTVDGKSVFDSKKLLLKNIDVKAFGGISTDTKDKKSPTSGPAQVTGPIQFAALNPSLITVILRDHQNTSKFQSNISENAQGAIATTQLVPFSINQVVGNVNPATALDTGLTEDEVILIVKALWNGVNNCRSRMKTGQDSRLFIKINYKDPFAKNAALHKLIKVTVPGSTEPREMEDVQWDFSALAKFVAKDSVKNVEYIVEDELESIFNEQMKAVKNKLVPLSPEL